MADVKADQCKRFGDTGWPGLGGGGTWEIDQRIGGVELTEQTFILVGVKDAPGHLDHDGAHPSGGAVARFDAGGKLHDLIEIFLTLLAVEAVPGDEIEHRLVHHNIEQRVVAALIDQPPGGPDSGPASSGSIVPVFHLEVAKAA